MLERRVMVQPGRRFCRPTRAAVLVAALAAAATPAAQDAGGTVPAIDMPQGAGARRSERLRSSLFTVEVHLLDFSGNLYDEDIRVNFVERIRDEKKFSSIAELSAQIQKDVQKARGLLTL